MRSALETIKPYSEAQREELAILKGMKIASFNLPLTKPMNLLAIDGSYAFILEIPLDLAKLTEKPFAIFGRTGSGKSILCKILCSSIIAKQAAALLIFDMHQEYGMF
ncbi:MAG: DUF87 domain-containing protein [Halobacteria archaeon]